MNVSRIFSSAASFIDRLSASSAPSTTTTNASSLTASTPTATANSASKLQADARLTGSSQGQALSSLAAKFQQASQTGDLSPLQSVHKPHGGHHHSGGSSASAAAAYQQNTDAFEAASSITGDEAQPQIRLSRALTPNSGTSTAAIAA